MDALRMIKYILQLILIFKSILDFSIVSGYVFSDFVMPFYYALEKSIWIPGVIYNIKH